MMRGVQRRSIPESGSALAMAPKMLLRRLPRRCSPVAFVWSNMAPEYQEVVERACRELIVAIVSVSEITRSVAEAGGSGLPPRETCHGIRVARFPVRCHPVRG